MRAVDWNAVTGAVTYSLVVNLHRLYAVFRNSGDYEGLASFLLDTMPWAYPLISIFGSQTIKELGIKDAYWGLTGTTLLVPWRFSTSMQGVGKTTAALYFACRPMTWEFWRRQGIEWVGPGRPPFDTIEECVDEVVRHALVVNTLRDLKALVRRAELEGVKYPVVVLDDIGAWASSRDSRSWRELTQVLTTFRRHVGIAIGTAAAINHVFFDIRRNTTLVGEVGQYGDEEGRRGTRVTWVRCVDNRYLCTSRGRVPINLGFGSLSTLISNDLVRRVRGTWGFEYVNTTLRSRLVMAAVKPGVDDVLEVLTEECPGDCPGDSLDAACVERVLSDFGVKAAFGGGCVGFNAVVERLRALLGG